MKSFWLRRIKCVIYRLDFTFSKSHVAQLVNGGKNQLLLPEGDLSANSNFIPCHDIVKWKWLIFSM